MTNNDRANFAKTALDAYRAAKGDADLDYSLIDLVTDLLHLNETLDDGYSPDEVLRISMMHFEAEQEDHD